MFRYLVVKKTVDDFNNNPTHDTLSKVKDVIVNLRHDYMSREYEKGLNEISDFIDEIDCKLGNSKETDDNVVFGFNMFLIYFVKKYLRPEVNRLIKLKADNDGEVN